MNKNDSDAGQIALKAASAAVRGTLYPFRIVEADGGATTPGTAIWQGEVFGFGPSYGGVSNAALGQDLGLDPALDHDHYAGRLSMNIGEVEIQLDGKTETLRSSLGAAKRVNAAGGFTHVMEQAHGL
jgi:hypothetical protein